MPTETIPDSVQTRDGTERIELTAPLPAGGEAILTPEALAFVATLHREFDERRLALLVRRQQRQAALDSGVMPDFLPETRQIRDSDWTVAPIPADLQKRHVEITGPVERKMVINALNSGADVFMADFEDSLAPTWQNVVEGQINLRDAVRREITFTNESGKRYELNEQVATLLVRPRGWHLDEKHLRIDGRPVSAALFDFGLYFFHNAHALLDRGTGPYFYLPKLESHHEARLWNDIFLRAQALLELPRGTIRATVLIETILAAFEMDEILWELREHAGGLNCGRWDYIFSIIKKFRNHPGFTLPDRAQVTMTTHMMRSYSLLTIKCCHRRGIHAIGGMAAQIPIKNDSAANEQALAKVRADKEREVTDGHDGTWVAHPALVAIARESFDRIEGNHQIGQRQEAINPTAADLLQVPAGAITEEGVRTNVRVGVQYLEAWLRGNGCVPLYHLMEDAATAEICRAQLWQWLHHGATLADGTAIDAGFFEKVLQEELAGLRETLGPSRYENGRYEQAGQLFREMTLNPEFVEFLTLVAYDHLD